MTRAPSRRRTGEALPRAEKFGDLITADHKVLNEGCESRDNHWYAVVEQDLATQWIQSYPCKKQRLHMRRRKRSSKLLESSHKPKVVYTDNSMEFGKAREDLSWIHRTSTLHRSETNGIAERAVRREKKVLEQYCYNQDWMKGGGLTLRNATAICEMSKTSWQVRQLRTKDDSENHLEAQ